MATSKDRAQWQAAAAMVRQHWQKWRLQTAAQRKEHRFTHKCLLGFSRAGLPFDPYWWA